MKNLFKKIFAMTVVLSMLLPLGNVAFAEEFDSTDDMTMQYLEDELKAYLEENHPEIEFGTVEFVDYLMGVLVEGTDEELEVLPNYNEICYYGAEYMYELEQVQVEMTEPFEIFLTSDEFRAKTIGEIKEEVRRKDAEDEKVYEQALDSRAAYAATSSTYDAAAAVRYARRHAEHPNTEEYKEYGRDCTNFVSQCIYAGGIPMRKVSNPPLGTKGTTKYWYSNLEREYHGNAYYTRVYDTSSWIRVEDFYDYSVLHGSAWVATVYSMKDLLNRVKAGDVVQLRRADGDWYHSIFVTGLNEEAKMAYCGHTGPRLDRALEEINETSTFRVLSFD